MNGPHSRTVEIYDFFLAIYGDEDVASVMAAIAINKMVDAQTVEQTAPVSKRERMAA